MQIQATREASITKQKTTEQRVVFTGGGTGGHVYPALALAERLLKKPGWSGIYIGVPGKAEEKILAGREDLPFHQAQSKGYPGLRSLQLPVFLFVLLFGMLQAGFHLLRFRPHLVVAAGGYASAPTLFAAALLRFLRILKVRLLIHEQNAAPGLFNRQAARFADLIVLSFPVSSNSFPAERSRTLGYPVRGGFTDPGSRETACQLLDLDPGKPVLFVFGGSQGAKTINEALYTCLPELLDRGIQVVHGYGMAAGPVYHAGEEHEAQIQHLLGTGDSSTLKSLMGSGYRARAYFEDIRPAYAAANLVVGRGGAGTLFELLQTGRALLVIPKMGLPGDHQVANARSASARGAAEVLLEELRPGGKGLESCVDPERLSKRVIELLDAPDRLRQLGEAALEMSEAKALDRLESAACVLCAEGRLPEEETETADFQISSLHASSTLSLLHKAQHNLVCDKDRSYVEYRALAALGSSSWSERNNGVKLCGQLGLQRALPLFRALLDDPRRPGRIAFMLGERHIQNGFIRRNMANALAAFQPSADCSELLHRLLSDPYWEARVAALSALTTHRTKAKPVTMEHVTRLAGGNFEERVAVAGWWAVCGQASTWKEWIVPMLDDTNCRVREAALRALSSKLETGELNLSDELRLKLNDVMLTSTYFHPLFPLKAALRDTAKAKGSAGC